MHFCAKFWLGYKKHSVIGQGKQPSESATDFAKEEIIINKRVLTAFSSLVLVNISVFKF